MSQLAKLQTGKKPPRCRQG